jgi:thiamine phosphate synthase YjbQ (UPF0047 family)
MLMDGNFSGVDLEIQSCLFLTECQSTYQILLQIHSTGALQIKSDEVQAHADMPNLMRYKWLKMDGVK